jgi:hypothetical protein
MTIEVPITLLLGDPLAWSYKAVLMARISLVRNTVRSLGAGRTTRHATALTQSDFRVSEWERLRTSARTNQGVAFFLVQQLLICMSPLIDWFTGLSGRHSSRWWRVLLYWIFYLGPWEDGKLIV